MCFTLVTTSIILKTITVISVTALNYIYNNNKYVYQIATECVKLYNIINRYDTMFVCVSLHLGIWVFWAISFLEHLSQQLYLSVMFPTNAKMTALAARSYHFVFKTSLSWWQSQPRFSSSRLCCVFFV